MDQSNSVEQVFGATVTYKKGNYYIFQLSQFFTFTSVLRAHFDIVYTEREKLSSTRVMLFILINNQLQLIH